MRIETLGLRAYGPFTGASLDLSQGASGLHVVFGSNEAGKSSALRALDAVLFGIKSRTTDNFLHEYSALRLAVTLVNANGDELTVVRRKATKHSLWNEDESDPLDDSVLRPFLGGLNSEEFGRVFGLDHIRLRAGSDRLLDTAEGVDAIIVGAALGLNDMRSVHEAIQAERSGLFSSRANKPVINAALAEWKRVAKDLREGSLSANEWKTARRDAKRSARDQSTAEALEKKLGARVTELEFGLRNRGRVLRLIDLRERLDDLSDAPDLDEGFADTRASAQEELRRATALLEEHTSDEEDLQGEVDSLTGDFLILEQSEDVAQLRDDSAVTEKGLRDKQKRSAEAKATEKERDRLAAALGLPVPLEAESVSDLHIAMGNQERCEDLLTEYSQLTASQEEATEDIRTLGSELEELVEQAQGEGNSIDLTPLEVAVADAMKLGDIDGDICERRNDIIELERDFSDGLARLSGFTGDPEEFERLPVPGSESLEEFRARFQSLAEEESEALRSLNGLRKQERETQGTIEEISRLGDVPSLDDLSGVRSRRDAQWSLVRQAWLEGSDVDDQAKELDPAAPLAEAFGRSIGESDDIADRMRDESERVAKLAAAQLRLEQLSTETQAAKLEANEREARRQTLDEERRAAWSGSGFKLGAPAAMKDQLEARDRLLEQLGDRRSAADKLKRLEDQRTTVRGPLRQALSELGSEMPGEESDEELTPLLLHADARRRALSTEAEERRTAETTATRLRSEIAKAKAGEERRVDKLARWRRNFAVATQGLPVRDEDAPTDVRQVLRQVKAILDANARASDLRDRIEKIDKDAADLASRVKEFFTAHIPDSSGDDDPDPSIEALKTLYERKKQQHAALDEASKRLRTVQKRQRDAGTKADVASRTLSDLARDAGAASAEALPALIRRADEKREYRNKLEALETDLLNEGCTINQTETRVTALEGVDIEADLTPLRERLARAHDDAVVARDEAREFNQVFKAMGGDSQAAESAAAAAGVTSSIREDAERYVRASLGAHLLSTAVQRFRERNEAPMLKMTSKYFSGLTMGRYARVETDIDSKGNPFFLVRESSDSASKTMDALSDGTRDQLHLALVLGSLEHRFASGAEPIPLVLDDVLVHFDDERSVAALEVLADFSRTTQVLLLTHHTRIREQSEALGQAKGAFVHDLEDAGGG